MKKILSLIAMLVMTATAFAETTSEKIVEDNYTLAGNVLSPKAVTVNWDTQKLVAVLDMTTCSDTENERVFSVSNNKTDVANWEQTNGGSTVHLFYTKDAKVWTGAGMETFHQKFAVQYRYQGDAGATSYYKEVTDPSTVTIVMDKTGISINGDLVFPAAEMSNLYGEGDNQLYFGAGCGTPGYATYKSVELVTEKAEPFSPVTLSKTDVANAVYNGTTTNYDAKTVDFVQYEEGKYKLVWKTLEAGSTIFGDYTIDNITVAEDAETHVLTLTTTDTEGTWSNVKSPYASMLGVTEGGKTAFTGFEGTCKLNETKDTIEKLKLKFNISIMGYEANLVFGEKASEPETGINATTVAEGAATLFTVDGVKLSKLQKGLNIVRSADGKVKKLLVK
ncbi:hypothetical protein [Leyella stercorea]|uniref:hypothetical protein n=1 Tax=Leyella stercorea TaxID=363265 RepID=UPI003FF0E5BD